MPNTREKNSTFVLLDAVENSREAGRCDVPWGVSRQQTIQPLQVSPTVREASAKNSSFLLLDAVEIPEKHAVAMFLEALVGSKLFSRCKLREP